LIETRIFHSLAEAEPLASQALGRATQPGLFDRYEWFSRTLAHCPARGAPMIACARQGEASAWLFLDRSSRTQAQACASWYTLAFAPVFAGDHAKRTRLLAALAKPLRQHLATITLAPMKPDDDAMLARAFAQAGWASRVDATGCNWTTDVAGQSFAQYWAARPGQLRKTVKAKRARANMAITIHDRFDDAAWDEYEAVYADSWKPDEGASAFLRAMAQAEGHAGTLRLGLGHVDGQAVAAQLWTCENGVAIAHKVAHRQQAAHLSPGSLLSAAMFEHAIDVDKVSTIDFGTGDDAYKRLWMDRCTPLHTLRLYNKRKVTGLIRAAAEGLTGRWRARGQPA